jgi:hypothetical protein
MFSLRHEFPSEWHHLRTVAGPGGDHTVVIELARDRFPGLFRNRTLSIAAVDVFGVPSEGSEPTTLPRLRPPGVPEDLELAASAPVERLLHQEGTLNTAASVEHGRAAGWLLTVPAHDVARQARGPAAGLHYSVE